MSGDGVSTTISKKMKVVNIKKSILDLHGRCLICIHVPKDAQPGGQVYITIKKDAVDQ